MFAVSVSPRYIHSRSSAGSFVHTINDPNDKYCRQHMEEIIRSFLPCRSYAGLAQLLDLDNMYGAGATGNRRYGLKVQWTPSMFKTSVFVDGSVGIEGLSRVRVADKCNKDSTIEMTDAEGRVIGLK